MVAAKIGWLKVKVNIGGQLGPVQGGGRKSIPTNVAFLVYETRGKVMYQNRSIIAIAITIVVISALLYSLFIACVSRACAPVYTLAHKTRHCTYNWRPASLMTAVEVPCFVYPVSPRHRVRFAHMTGDDAAISYIKKAQVLQINPPSPWVHLSTSQNKNPIAPPTINKIIIRIIRPVWPMVCILLLYKSV